MLRINIHRNLGLAIFAEAQSLNEFQDATYYTSTKYSWISVKELKVGSDRKENAAQCHSLITILIRTGARERV